MINHLFHAIIVAWILLNSYTVLKCKCQNNVLVLSEVFSEPSQVTMREMFPEMF